MNVDAVSAGLNVIEPRAGMKLEVGNKTFDEAENNDLHGSLCA
jgi:hypothetical protein